MSRRSLGLAFTLLLLLPGALAHEEDAPPTSGSVRPAEEPAIPAGYTGPGREPYLSWFEGVWLYGQASVTPLGKQLPRDMHGDGEWLVWEDAVVGDLFAFHVPAGSGYYLQTDPWEQRHPRVSEGVVVYEDHRDPYRPRVYAHFLETGETRPLSNATGYARNPSIDGGVVAWVDERSRQSDVWAYSLHNDTAFPVATTPDRESDPLVLDDRIYWRTYRFNVWDVQGFDLETGEPFQVTSDVEMQGAPFTNGKDVLFLSQLHGGWELKRYHTRDERVTIQNYRTGTMGRISASGDALLVVARDDVYHQLIIRNVTAGTTQHVSGNLLLTTEPHLSGRTAFAVVKTVNGTSLLQLDVSPFALGRQASLSVTTPASRSPWVRPLTVQGVLTGGEGFTEPLTFTYRLDGGAPQVIPAADRWRFTLDPTGVEPGVHVVDIRATFREGPPAETRIVLVVPSALRTVDVGEAGPAWHAARLMEEANFYVLQNPAAWILLPLLLLLLLLVALRVWLLVKPRRRVRAVEYVAPDEA